MINHPDDLRLFVPALSDWQKQKNKKRDSISHHECLSNLPSWPKVLDTCTMVSPLTMSTAPPPQIPDSRNRRDSLVMVAIGWSLLYYVASTADLDLDLRR